MKYIKHVRSKGRNYWYFRHGDKVTKIPHEPGHPEFIAKYDELLASIKKKPSRRWSMPKNYVVRRAIIDPHLAIVLDQRALDHNVPNAMFYGGMIASRPQRTSLWDRIKGLL